MPQWPWLAVKDGSKMPTRWLQNDYKQTTKWLEDDITKILRQLSYRLKKRLWCLWKD